jgi:hypothetical protein
MAICCAFEKLVITSNETVNIKFEIFIGLLIVVDESILNVGLKILKIITAFNGCK